MIRLVAIAWLSLATQVAAADGVQQLTLASGGKAHHPVVVSPQAGEDLRQIAAELADYLGRISGATFAVQTGDGSRGIVLGTLAQFPDAALAKDLEIRNTYDGREAYVIRTESQRLRLIGATDLGASHAAFRLLETLGCRWLFPAPQWEIVPKATSLAARLNESDRPVILARRIWWGYGFFDRDRCLKDYQAWARHNRMGSSFQFSCGHAWQSIIAGNKKVFDAHP